VECGSKLDYDRQIWLQSGIFRCLDVGEVNKGTELRRFHRSGDTVTNDSAIAQRENSPWLKITGTFAALSEKSRVGSVK
jgi:hypothetical protein